MDELQGFTRAQQIWARIAVWSAFMVVGGSAAVQSFKHIREVALIGHQTELVAYLMPLSIDGMMAIASVAMVEDKAYGRHPRPWARWGLWFGLTASLGANVASQVAVWGWDWLGIIVAGLPPVLLLWSVEIVSKPGKLRKVAEVIARVSGHITRQDKALPAVEPAPSPDTTPAQNDAPARRPAAAEPPTETAQADRTAAASPRWRRPEDNEPLPEELVTMARQVGGQHRDKTGREITRDGLRTGLRAAGWQRGISNVTAGRLLDLIRAGDQPQADSTEETARPMAAANGR